MLRQQHPFHGLHRLRTRDLCRQYRSTVEYMPAEVREAASEVGTTVTVLSGDHQRSFRTLGADGDS